MKQLITSSLVYASDTDDRFPLKDSWNDTTREFRNPAYTIRCPLLPETDFGYAFNAALSGTKPPKMPEKVPLNFESTRPGSNPSDTFTSLPRPGRHDGKNSIGYADGHAKSVGF
ncbi:hypothetical protein EON79_06715 [bacterium]|nr:MAG: hypothetical protein EON79_06715 [bacterium]